MLGTAVAVGTAALACQACSWLVSRTDCQEASAEAWTFLARHLAGPVGVPGTAVAGVVAVEAGLAERSWSCQLEVRNQAFLMVSVVLVTLAPADTSLQVKPAATPVRMTSGVPVATYLLCRSSTRSWCTWTCTEGSQECYADRLHARVMWARAGLCVHLESSTRAESTLCPSRGLPSFRKSTRSAVGTERRYKPRLVFRSQRDRRSLSTTTRCGGGATRGWSYVCWIQGKARAGR